MDNEKIEKFLPMGLCKNRKTSLWTKMKEKNKQYAI